MVNTKSAFSGLATATLLGLAGAAGIPCPTGTAYYTNVQGALPTRGALPG